MARLHDFYKAEVATALMNKFSYKSVMQIPRLDKIVINVGAGSGFSLCLEIGRASCRERV